MCNFMFRFLESSEQVPGSSETLRLPCPFETHRWDPTCLVLILPQTISESLFPVMGDIFLGRTGTLAETLLRGGYPPTQMLVRHKKRCRLKFHLLEGGSFIILENISWLFAIIPGRFHARKYSWLCQPTEIAYKAVSTLHQCSSVG